MISRLFRNVILLCALALGSVMALILATPHTPDFNTNGIKVKEAALKQAPSPKVVFLSGSSGAFGVDSPRIQQALGRPVVNMGLNAPLGVEFMMNEVAGSIKPGDLIVLAPEYHLFYPEIMDEWHPATKYYPWIVFDSQPASVQYFPAQKLAQAVSVSPSQLMRLTQERLQNKFFPQKKANPKEYTFDANGDFLGHLDLPGAVSYTEVETYTLFERGYREPDAHIVSAINQFADFAAQKGAQVVMVYPPLMDVYFDANADGIARLDRSLRGQLRLPILSSPQDFRLPLSYFYDTVYHLNAKGREARADKLIAILK